MSSKNSISGFHSLAVLEQWDTLIQNITPRLVDIKLNGNSLQIATIVAVARYGARTRLHDGTKHETEKSSRTIQSSLNEGKVIYGVNTGVGASADTRTNEVYELQDTIIRQFHSGILVNPKNKNADPNSDNGNNGHASTARFLNRALPVDGSIITTCMPESWVRASILIRSNSLAKGYSGVRVNLIQLLIDLLNNDITPRIPLRGSISASGDLMPLAYIGGALQGRSGTSVWVGNHSSGSRRIMTADHALAEASLKPLVFGPKEALAVVNGTSVSAGVAALAMYDANCLALFSQILTAMSTEALSGTDESFDPFFAQVRAHPGQIEASFNIYNFLTGSKLIRRHGNDTKDNGLYQDRYSIRTAPQWIGPILEDFLLATRQVTIECNSTTDNPLLDPERGRVLCGGNFQAKSITSAMEKVRLGLHSIGQMLFAQCTELINPKLSNGLPPNLVADEPSRSFLMKPLDVAIASLQSELGFLANPVGSHVLSAEMGNQSINSLALISARYSLTAIDILSQLCAVHLFALCQALDLRAMHTTFLERFEPVFRYETTKMLALLGDQGSLDAQCSQLWSQFINGLDETTARDSAARFVAAFESLQLTVLNLGRIASADAISILKIWTHKCSDLALNAFHANGATYASQPVAGSSLGRAAKRMYEFIRSELSVPFIQADERMTGKVTVGSYITAIYEAIRNGVCFLPVMECLKDVTLEGYVDYPHSVKL